MLDYYYVDLYFDPEQIAFEKIVDSCVSSLIASGCKFEQVTMSNPVAGQNVTFGEHVDLGPGDVPSVAAAYAREMIQSGKKVISFPPLGRIMFSYPFRLDNAALEDVHEEEEESHSSFEDIGLTFTYTASTGSGQTVKASLSFWEEYVLKSGAPELQVRNMRDVLGMVSRIARATPPFFGAMNTELHLNTDASLSLLKGGRLPEGNEFVIVGRALISKLDVKALKESRYQVAPLPGGGAIIQMTDKWGGLKAV